MKKWYYLCFALLLAFAFAACSDDDDSDSSSNSIVGTWECVDNGSYGYHYQEELILTNDSRWSIRWNEGYTDADGVERDFYGWERGTYTYFDDIKQLEMIITSSGDPKDIGEVWSYMVVLSGNTMVLVEPDGDESTYYRQ